MSDVELVALWLGLGAGLISIVLAIVAMVFTFAVDRRSSSINEQMIQSLQKIESSVEGTATNTKDLIKVAWDRMLPEPESSRLDDSGESEGEDDSVKAIAAGVAAELRAELTSADGGASEEAIKGLNAAVRRMERTLQAQLTSAPGTASTSRQRFSKLQTEIEELTPVGRALLGELSRHGHLERDQYRALQETRLAAATRDLRKRGFLTPLRGTDKNGDDVPVYWLSPALHRMVGPALDVSDPVGAGTRSAVRKILRTVGYLPAPGPAPAPESGGGGGDGDGDGDGDASP